MSANDSRRSSASSRADTPLLEASTASLRIDDPIAGLTTLEDDLVVGHPPSAPSPLELRAFDVRPPKSRFAATLNLARLDLVSPCDPNLNCPICIAPMVNPKKLRCDHIFCHDCIYQTFAFQSGPYPTCPMCRRRVDAGEDVMDVPRVLKQMLDDLIVKCPNHELGCGWKAKRGEAQEHMDYFCDYRLVECPSENCVEAMMHKDVHRGCLHKYIVCEDCGERMMEVELERHQLQQCPHRVDTCPMCNDQVIRPLMKKHWDEVCSKSVIACPGQSVGCDHQRIREEMHEHIQECVLARIAPSIQNSLQSMKTRQDDLASENERLRRRVDYLEAFTNSLQERVLDTLPPSSLEGLGSAPHMVNPSQHLVESQEFLRNEVSRISAAVVDAEARTTLLVHNEVLRLGNEMARIDAAVGATRAQQQWLINQRLQAMAQMRAAAAANAANTPGHGSTTPSISVTPAVSSSASTQAGPSSTAATIPSAVATVGTAAYGSSSSNTNTIRPLRRRSSGDSGGTKL
ncbi:uncharacterized protein K452DRAFT_220392 [Aplosporella prunicola CBS 121167]|uniref:RING-type domain-containing protein n=1 Tax=Aplosporella prunicola CBS 121167 TaxID=1176127 RepID=A0A6A6BS59_9PEZI|nr:uncharacterized protein K452DRAFT_220392 [Aplosporella prunicola CBS 121167]KAF2145411.1 hypothetical protein K452DRAFT_220392 [Aplosporella prunicola CBS 121167]